MTREEFNKKYDGFVTVSLDISDGWLSLVDKLCSMIRHKLDTITKYNDIWLENEVIDMFKHATNQALVQDFKIVQIKEKFGGLRFYVDGADKEINAWISFAESMSYEICEECGTNQNIGTTSGWIRTICGACSTKIKKQDVWKSNEDRKKEREEFKNKSSNNNK
jgi:hypothetical protein